MSYTGRVAAADKADKEKNRTAFDVVAKKFKRVTRETLQLFFFFNSPLLQSRSKHLEELESSNFGMLRGAAEAIIAGSGAADDDAAAEVIGKKAKKTRTGRTEQAMSKKPLGQILYESVSAPSHMKIPATRAKILTAHNCVDRNSRSGHHGCPTT